MLVWNGSLPLGCRRDAGGLLYLGDAPADALARAYGTPLIVVNTATIRDAIDRFKAVCDPLGIGFSYAAKAFVCTEMARLLSAKGVGMDVCSLGELEIAESGGYAAERLTMHGAGKTDAELRAALDGRVGRIIVDGLSDLRRLAELAETAGGDEINVVLRLNTGIELDTHPHVLTVGDEAKFGLALEEEAEAAEIVRSSPALVFAGLHAHAGSQIADSSALVENLSALVQAARRFAARGLASRRLIAGGGFGIQYDPARLQDELDVEAAITACADFVTKEGSFGPAALEFEPGRSIVAHAGTTIYEVLAVKRRGDGNIVVVDGGMADNPRPMLYGSYHHIVPVADTGAPLRPTTVFGRACESDYIGKVSLPDSLDRGDLLAVCTTGAYTYSMASNYNAFPTPAVVAVSGDEHQRWLDRRPALF